MPPYHDVYVLASDRSARIAERFLETFVPERQPSASEYEFPQYAQQPSVVFDSAHEAILYCQNHVTEQHSLYFRNLGDQPAHAMLFFTSDGSLILGLSVIERQEEWLARLQHCAASEIGYITLETPPSETAAAFRVLAAGVGRP